MHADADLESALNDIPPKKIADQLVRVVTTSTLLGMVSGTVTRIRPNLLFAGGPTLVGGRFTPNGGPKALYVAFSEATARAEWENGLMRLYPGVASPPKTVFYVDVELARVLDVTLAKNQSLLGTDSKELVSEWKGLTLPPTQRLGVAVYKSNCFSAIRFRSSRAKRGYCLVIFPDRLSRAEESVGVSDPMGILVNPYKFSSTRSLYFGESDELWKLGRQSRKTSERQISYTFISDFSKR